MLPHQLVTELIRASSSTISDQFEGLKQLDAGVSLGEELQYVGNHVEAFHRSCILQGGIDVGSDKGNVGREKADRATAAYGTVKA
jgi:hypothetical protein